MCDVYIHSTHVCCVYTQHTCVLCIHTAHMSVVYIHSTCVLCICTYARTCGMLVGTLRLTLARPIMMNSFSTWRRTSLEKTQDHHADLRAAERRRTCSRRGTSASEGQAEELKTFSSLSKIRSLTLSSESAPTDTLWVRGTCGLSISGS